MVDTDRHFVERLETMCLAADDLDEITFWQAALDDEPTEERDEFMSVADLKKNWVGILQALLLTTISVIGGLLLSGLEREAGFNRDTRSLIGESEKRTLELIDQIKQLVVTHVDQPGHREYIEWRRHHDARMDTVEANQKRITETLERIDKTLVKLENKP